MDPADRKTFFKCAKKPIDDYWNITRPVGRIADAFIARRVLGDEFSIYKIRKHRKKFNRTFRKRLFVHTCVISRVRGTKSRIDNSLVYVRLRRSGSGSGSGVRYKSATFCNLFRIEAARNNFDVSCRKTFRIIGYVNGFVANAVYTKFRIRRR